MKPLKVEEFFLQHENDDLDFDGVKEKLSDKYDLHIMCRINGLLQGYPAGAKDPPKSLIRWHEHERVCLTDKDEFEYLCSKLSEKTCFEFIACNVILEDRMFVLCL